MSQDPSDHRQPLTISLPKWSAEECHRIGTEIVQRVRGAIQTVSSPSVLNVFVDYDKRHTTLDDEDRPPVDVYDSPSDNGGFEESEISTHTGSIVFVNEPDFIPPRSDGPLGLASLGPGQLLLIDRENEWASRSTNISAIVALCPFEMAKKEDPSTGIVFDQGLISFGTCSAKTPLVRTAANTTCWRTWSTLAAKGRIFLFSTAINDRAHQERLLQLPKWKELEGELRCLISNTAVPQVMRTGGYSRRPR